jgi:hypothetical protein
MDCFLKIYLAFKGAYPRATELVNTLYDLTDEVVVNTILRTSKKWQNYKNTVKLVHAIINLTRSCTLIQGENKPKLKQEIKRMCVQGFPEEIKRISRARGYSLQKEMLGTQLAELIPIPDTCIVVRGTKSTEKIPFDDKFIQKDLTDQT